MSQDERSCEVIRNRLQGWLRLALLQQFGEELLRSVPSNSQQLLCQSDYEFWLGQVELEIGAKGCVA